eukprot:5186442-Alexandrium_andersonii.AAC.1
MPHGKKRATKDTLKILKSDGKAVLKKPSRKKVQDCGRAKPKQPAVRFEDVGLPLFSACHRGIAPPLVPGLVLRPCATPLQILGCFLTSVPPRAYIGLCVLICARYVEAVHGPAKFMLRMHQALARFIDSEGRWSRFLRNSKDSQRQTYMESWPCQEQWSLGTAFSGMEAVTFALRQIGMEGKYAHRFTIEKDQACNSFICQNCDVDEMHTDITAVKLEELQPVDVFVAGFPCQPFSLAGLREGSEDSKGRGKMFDYCLNYIAMHLPKAFILENVAALRLDKRFAGMWTYITEALEKLENYVISEKVMDTRESGLPHVDNSVSSKRV